MEVLTTYSLKCVYSIFSAHVIILSFSTYCLTLDHHFPNLLQQHIWNLFAIQMEKASFKAG